MTPQRSQQIDDIFSRARGIVGDRERVRYLDETCGSDGELRCSVESLLRHHAASELDLFSSVPGKCLSHYQIIEEVGRGTTGTVYKAIDVRMNGELVALKVLRPALAADPEIKRRFRREARHLRRLRHPNVVRVREIVQDRGRLFIVMEYVPGETLNRLIPPSGFSMPESLSLAAQMVEALAAAHQAGIIHRDLKPSNLIVNSQHHLRVVDFGLAKACSDAVGSESADKTLPGLILGTAGYMSPEQRRGQPCDARSDLWSVGAILYEMITGQRAFERTFQADNAKAPDLSIGLPAGVATILKRCLEIDVERRYQTAGDLLADLRGAAQPLAQLPGRAVWPRAAHLSSRQRIWAATAVLGLGLVAIPAHWLIQHTPASPGEASAVSRPQFDGSARAHYYSGIRHQETSDALCFERASGGCQTEATIKELKVQITDFDAVLQARPNHASSLWNRGLAYSGLCELQSGSMDWENARIACGRSLADFEALLKPGPSYPDLPTSEPDKASVLWQRGLTHALRAHIRGLPAEEYLSDLNQALRNFDTIVKDKVRYGDFLEKRQTALIRERTAVSREREKAIHGNTDD